MADKCRSDVAARRQLQEVTRHATTAEGDKTNVRRRAELSLAEPIDPIPVLRGRSVCVAVAGTFVLWLVKCKLLSARDSLEDG